MHFFRRGGGGGGGGGGRLLQMKRQLSQIWWQRVINRHFPTCISIDSTYSSGELILVSLRISGSKLSCFVLIFFAFLHLNPMEGRGGTVYMDKYGIFLSVVKAIFNKMDL